MPFWEDKSLQQMSQTEWEALCDGCGKCCLHKLIDSDEPAAEGTDGLMHAEESLHYTDVRCRYLDPDTARCGCYAERLDRVPDCVNITLADLPHIHFMPPSCAYRRLHEGKGLPHWHPLLHSGSVAPMQAAGMSITTHRTVSDTQVAEDDYELRIVTWPLN
ncbi:YcgN family cysteine cluster protein [Aliidiomarina sp. Khilg15.8]